MKLRVETVRSSTNPKTGVRYSFSRPLSAQRAFVEHMEAEKSGIPSGALITVD
jgi:hypothetical protein